MSSVEHRHLDRIQAVAYVSAMYALADCAHEALKEHDDVSYRPAPPVYALLEAWADQIMEPFGVANVLQTVEEYIATNRSTLHGVRLVMDADDLTVTFGWENRAAVVMAIVDAALAAREDEREAEHA